MFADHQKVLPESSTGRFREGGRRQQVQQGDRELRKGVQGPHLGRHRPNDPGEQLQVDQRFGGGPQLQPA